MKLGVHVKQIKQYLLKSLLMVGVLMSVVPAYGEKGDANALVGTEAPDFTLKNLAGERVTLSSHENESIVVLDLWATWCGPCVRAMPELQKVAEAYKDKGVVVYAVNQQEGKLKVEKFLERRKISLTVLLDKKAEVGTAYRAEAIPQTVIIDKEGTIRAVHVGYSPRLGSMLSRELDLLLEGKELPGS